MIVALNNKSNLTTIEFKKYYQELSNIDNKHHEIILCPSFMNIPLINTDVIKVGSQNVSKFGMGSYTGEVNASQLLDAGVAYCFVGHSDRRKYNQESNDDINKKIKQLLQVGITPILCIGETREERENNTYRNVLTKQIREGLVDLNNVGNIIVAYEPVWSIGTGLIPSNEEIEEAFIFIKQLLPNQIILYGGSANEENIDELKKVDLIDGYLLGGLSLKPDKLQQFIDKL